MFFVYLTAYVSSNHSFSDKILLFIHLWPLFFDDLAVDWIDWTDYDYFRLGKNVS